MSISSFLTAQSSCTSGLVFIVWAYCLWSTVAYFLSPLKKYPGPIAARWTRLWYLYHSGSGKYQLTLKRLHDKYGPIVRIAPNIIDIDIPEMIQVVFGTKGEWMKTEFYHGGGALVNGRVVHNLFSQTDPIKHKKERRPIAKYYSSASTTALEPHMDKIINKLCHELEAKFMSSSSESTSIDFGSWILYYTWDVIGAVTFSETYGYLDQGKDFDNSIRNAHKAIDYFCVIGTMPFLDHFLDKNKYYQIGPPGLNNITRVSIQRLMDRYQGKSKDTYDPEAPDFLDKFIDAKRADPDFVDDSQIISWLMVNTIAGADTTAITIRSTFYFSMKHPRVWERLTREVVGAGLGMETPASYKDAHVLPYVDAVVRESLRFLPGVSMTLQRYVPRDGYTLPSGDYLPGGVIVGMSPYVTNRNKSIYGEDADEFRPERWLRDEEGGESEADFQTRLTRMNKGDLSFGGGSRFCIGRNIGLFQTYKILVTLISRYHIELATDKEWKVVTSWFPRQEGLEVRMSKRL